MTLPPPRGDTTPPGVRTGARPPSRVEILRAVEELESLAPDLGWSEATSLADGLIDALAHRYADLAEDRAEPTSLPLVVGAIGGVDGPVDHASCRAVAARLRSMAPGLVEAGARLAWAGSAGQVMGELAELLDRVADRARGGRTGPADKGVVLRRLHGLQRQLR